MVPNGKDFGKLLGDRYPLEDALKQQKVLSESDHDYEDLKDEWGHQKNASNILQDETEEPGYFHHPWGVFFTILGTVLLDFDADACQSPSRAYLLDVTLPGATLIYQCS